MVDTKPNLEGYEALAAEQWRITEIGREISTAAELTDAYPNIAEHIQVLVPSDRFVISIYHEDNEVVEEVFIHGLAVEGSFVGNRQRVEWPNVHREVFHQQKHLVLNGDELVEFNPESTEARARFDIGLRSLLSVPLATRNRVVGFLNFRSIEPDAYGQHEVDIAWQIANQIAGAIGASVQHENFRREVEIRERVAEVGRIVSSTLDFSDKFPSFAEHVRALVPSDRLVISVMTEDGEILNHQLADGVELEGSVTGTSLPMIHDELYKHVIEDQKHFEAGGDVYREHAKKSEREQARWDAGLRSFLLIPLVWQGDTKGVISFRSADPEAYSPEVTEIGWQIANHVAGAVATAGQYERLEKESERQERLAEIGRIVSSSLEVEEIYPRLAETTLQLVPADRLVIAVLSSDHESLVTRYVHGLELDDNVVASRIELNRDDMYQHLFVEHRIFEACDDEYIRFAEGNPVEALAISKGLRSLLLVPLIWQSRTVGIIALRSTDPMAYKPRVVDTARQIANQVAGALATAEQYEQLERESHERERLAEIGRIISSSLEIEDVFPKFAENAAELVPADRLVISVLSDEGDALVHRYIHGMELESAVVDLRLRIGQNELQKQLFVDQRSFSACGDEYLEFATQGAFESAAMEHGLRSLLLVPLVWQSRTVGIMSFRSINPEAYTAGVIDTADQIARQIAGALATAEQYDLLELESYERERIAEIGRIVSQSLDVDDVHRLFAEQAKQLIPFDRLVISSYSENGTRLVEQFVSGVGEEDGVSPTSFLVRSDEIHENIFQNHRYLLSAGADFEEFAKDIPIEQERYAAGFRALLIVPMVWQGETVGSLSFRSFEPDAFTQHRIDLAMQISGQVAGAIYTAAQYENVALQSFEQERIAEIGRIVSSTLNLDDIYKEFTEQAKELVPYDRLVIAVYEDDRNVLVEQFVSGIGSETHKKGTRITGGDRRPVILERERILTLSGSDLEDYAQASELELERWESGFRSLLVVPMFWQRTPIGTLAFRSFDTDAFGPRQIDLAQQISGQVAGAISAAHQYEELDTQSRDRERVAEIVRIVSSSLDVRDVLEAFSDEVRELIPFDRFAIAQVDPESGLLSDTRVEGISVVEENMSGPKTLVGGGLPRPVFEELRTVVLDDPGLAELAKTSDTPRRLPELISAMFVPIVLQGRLIAALTFRSTLPEPYGDREVNLSDQIASQIAGVIGASQQLTLIERESTERQRLASEQASIAEIGRIVSSSLDLDEAYVAFEAQARELVPFDRIVITAVNEDLTEVSDRYVGGIAIESDRGRLPDPIENNPTQHNAILTQKTVVANGDEYAALISHDQLEKVRFESGLNSMLLIPLVWQGRTVGTLNFRSVDPDAFTPRVVGLATQIAAQIAGPMFTASQYALIEQESTERQRLADEQASIAEIGRIVSSSVDLDDVFSSFVNQARNLVGFDRLVISLLDTNGDHFTDAFIHGDEIDDFKSDNTHPVKGDVKETVFKTNAPFVANHDRIKKIAEEMPSETTRYEAGLNSLLVVPLMWQDSVIGTLALRSREHDQYDNRSVELAQQIGAQIAGAVTVSNQYALLQSESSERQQLAEDHAAIAEIGRIASSTLDLQEGLSAFVEQARQLVPFDRIVVSVANEDVSGFSYVLVEGTEVDETTHGNTSRATDVSLEFNVVNDQKLLSASGDEYLELIKDNPLEMRRWEAGLRSVLIVPLIWQGQGIGTLNLRSTADNAYGPREIDLTEQIAAQVAGAIATVNQYALLDKESSERQQLAEDQATIAEIGRIVSSTLDLEEGLSAFVEHSRSLVPFDRIVIAAANEEVTEVTDFVVEGTEVHESAARTSYPIEDIPLLAEVIKSGEHYVANGTDYIDHVEMHPIERRRYDAGLKSVLLVPLMWRGKGIGALNYRSKLDSAYGPREVELAKQIAAQIAGAIAAADQYRNLERETSERELLGGIALRASQSVDLAELFEALADDLSSIMEFDRIAIATHDWETSRRTIVYARGQTEGYWQVGEPQDVTVRVPDIEDETERNAQIWRDSFKLSGAEMESDEWLKSYRAGRFDPDTDWYTHSSWVEVPIGVPDQLPEGFLSLRTAGRDRFTPHDQKLLAGVAVQVSQAIENARSRDLLAVSEANYRDLVENALTLVARLDSQWRFTYTNPAWERVLGYSADELHGEPFSSFQPERLRRESQESFDEIVSGNPATTEIGLVARDGLERTFTIDLLPVLSPDNRFVGARVIGVDVTAERAAQADLRTQAAALEAASDAVVILKPDTSIEYVNQALIDETGYSREELIGRVSPFMRRGDEPPELYDGIWKTVRAGNVWRGTLGSRRKDGSLYTVDTSLNPILGEDGNISRFIGIRRDITERLQAEQDREARRQLDTQNEQLQRINDERDEFFSSVSHELRTPLTSVLAFADILSRNRDSNLSEAQLEHIDVIKRNSRALNGLVEDMLDISRLNADRLRLESSEFELHSLVNSVVESMDPTARQRNQSLEVDGYSEPIWITADQGRVTQILSNLITNSCKYSPDETKITVRVEQAQDDAVVTVEDEGFGISSEDLSEIFSPFFRSERNEIRNESGTGLGLAISKTLVELHGGMIEASSEIGKGTTIRISLPGATSTPRGISGSNPT